jgi:hypothetical protein
LWWWTGDGDVKADSTVRAGVVEKGWGGWIRVEGKIKWACMWVRR